MYQGDIRLGDTLYFHFSTRQFSSGGPFLLAGSPVISAYPQDSTTQLTAGITLTTSFDSLPGLNSVKVVATSGNGYATATNYTLVITTGTVDSVSVVGEVIGSFSIEARSAVMPTVAARTLDISATGEAGLDWANIGSPTTTVNLSGTTVKTATDIATAIVTLQADTDDIQTRLPAALVSGRMDSSVGAYASGQAPLQPTTAGRTLDVTTTGEAGIDWSNIGAPTTTVNLSGTTIKTATDIASAIVTLQADTDDIQTRLPATLVSGRMDSSVGAYQSGQVPLQPTVAGRTLDVSATGEAGVDWANVGSPTTVVGLSGTTIKAVTDGVTVTTNNDKTGYSIGVGGIAASAFAASAIDAAALASSAANEIADALLLRDLATGSSSSDRNVQNALRTLRNRVSIATGGAVIVYEEDDTTTAWSGSATRDALAEPITEIVPA